jgi:hypothetical protein
MVDRHYSLNLKPWSAITLYVDADQALKYRSVTDIERKPPDILSDQSETEVYCLSDPSVLVSDRTVALSDVNQKVP